MAGDPELALTVGPEAAGQRLDQFLAGPLESRSRAARLIEQGRVSVDGVPARKRHVVAAGQAVVVLALPSDRGARAGQPGSAPHTVVYEDDDLLVVDKPAGVVVHPARGHAEGTLAQALAGRAGGGADPGRAGIVHRLDRDTSGLLVVARTEVAHRRLQRMLRDRELTREYRALVDGRPPARTGTIEAPIGRDRRDRTLHSLETDTLRDAVTHFVLVEALPSTTLLAVTLDTGRTHQIRVHLRAIGHPVIGDPSYGTPGRDYGLDRQFLHATRLAFAHPATGDPVEITSPLPPDLAEALDRARRG